MLSHETEILFRFCSTASRFQGIAHFLIPPLTTMLNGKTRTNIAKI